MKKVLLILACGIAAQLSYAQATPKWAGKAKKAVFSIVTYDKDTKNLRKNGRMRAKCDKWLVHIPFLCYLTILLNLAEGAEYGGC